MTKPKNQTKPKRYDWREGVCQFCGIKAVNGCCEKHSMNCKVCKGYGATTKEVWEEYHKRQYNNNRLEKALLVFQKHDTGFEICISSEGGHYDHGDEPNIRIIKDGKEIYHNWGIYVPALVLEAAEWLKGNYHG